MGLCCRRVTPWEWHPVAADRRGSELTDLGTTPTDQGTVDAAVAPGGRFIHVRAGLTGQVDEFAVDHDGSLDPLGSLTVPGAAGGEGIAVG